jgi:hypothetical protein
MAEEKYVADAEYTWAELLALWKQCYARISVSGQSYQFNIGGGTRMYTQADLKYVKEQIVFCQQQIDLETSAATANGGAQNLVQFRRAC